MPRHIVLKDEYGDAIQNIAHIKKQKLGTATEALLDTIPEVQKELAKIRSKK
jgi:hypothetical protein